MVIIVPGYKQTVVKYPAFKSYFSLLNQIPIAIKSLIVNPVNESYLFYSFSNVCISFKNWDNGKIK